MNGWLVGWLVGRSKFRCLEMWRIWKNTELSNWHIQIRTLARTLCLHLRRPYLFVCINNFLYVELRTNIRNVMIDLQRLPSTPIEWSNYDVTKTHKSSNHISLMFLPSTFAKHHPPKKRCAPKKSGFIQCIGPWYLQGPFWVLQESLLQHWPPWFVSHEVHEATPEATSTRPHIIPKWKKWTRRWNEYPWWKHIPYGRPYQIMTVIQIHGPWKMGKFEMRTFSHVAFSIPIPSEKSVVFFWNSSNPPPPPLNQLNGSEAGNHYWNRDTMKFLLVTSTIKTCKVKGNSCFQGFGGEYIISMIFYWIVCLKKIPGEKGTISMLNFADSNVDPKLGWWDFSAWHAHRLCNQLLVNWC